jgi:septal ring factor EnvC (AmiA/AmiB activator)
MNWKTHLILAVGLAALATLGFLYVREQGAASEREKQFKARVEAFELEVKKSNEVARNLEAQLTAMRAGNEQLKKELDDESNRNPVYTTSACNTPVDGLRLYNAARQGASAR